MAAYVAARAQPLVRARIAVFADLWERGFTLSSGARFGADFLVYPGDPLCFHALYVATVCVAPDQPLGPRTITAVGRLATSVRKRALLCAVAPGGSAAPDTVRYICLEWSGIGL
jgi:tRNA-splicing endonuclease subunit Sen34